MRRFIWHRDSRSTVEAVWQMILLTYDPNTRNIEIEILSLTEE